MAPREPRGPGSSATWRKPWSRTRPPSAARWRSRRCSPLGPWRLGFLVFVVGGPELDRKAVGFWGISLGLKVLGEVFLVLKGNQRKTNFLGSQEFDT